MDYLIPNPFFIGLLPEHAPGKLVVTLSRKDGKRALLLPRIGVRGRLRFGHSEDIDVDRIGPHRQSDLSAIFGDSSII